MRITTGVLTTVLVLACVGLLTGVARADTITLNGYFNDNANAALVWADLSPALFGDDGEIANNVALYDVAIPFGGNVRFLSLGYGVGGADPYFTLFLGTGPGATFLGSNYAQAFSTGGDFDLTFGLAAGSYTVAMGVFANMSFAENLGSGTLGDGFNQLGGPSYLGDPLGNRNYYYELAVTRPDQEEPVIPEPATMLLLGSGLAGLVAARRRLKKS